MGGLIAGLAIGGIGLGVAGGMMQAKAQKAQANAQIAAAKENRSYDEKNALVDMGRMLRTAYGNRAPMMATSVLSPQEIGSLFGYSPQYYAMQEANVRGLTQQTASLKAQLAGLQSQQKNAVINDPTIKQLNDQIKAAQENKKVAGLTDEQKKTIDAQIKSYQEQVKTRTATVQAWANTELAQQINSTNAAITRSAANLAQSQKMLKSTSPDPYFNQAQQQYMPNPMAQPYPTGPSIPPYGPQNPPPPIDPNARAAFQQQLSQLGPAQAQLMASGGGGGPAFLQQAAMLSASPQAQMARGTSESMSGILSKLQSDPTQPINLQDLATQYGLSPTAIASIQQFATRYGLDPNNITPQQIQNVISTTGVDPLAFIAGQGGVQLPQGENAYAALLNAYQANQPLPGQPGYQGYDPNEGYISTMSRLLNQYDLENQALYDLYGRETAQLRGEAAANLDAMSGFGRERMNIIDRDRARAQQEAQASIAAQMARSGLGGSTLTAQALSQNAKQLMEGAADKKATIQDQLMQMQAEQRQANLNLLAGRLAGGTEMRGQILRESQSLRQQPLMQEINLLTGGTFTPFANKDTSAYFPGVTSAGIGSGIMGGLVGSLGGQLTGMAQQGLANKLGLGK